MVKNSLQPQGLPALRHAVAGATGAQQCEHDSGALMDLDGIPSHRLDARCASSRPSWRFIKSRWLPMNRCA